MIIGFDAKRIFHNRSGLGNYGRNLVRSLEQHAPELEMRLYNPWLGSIDFQTSPRIIEVRPNTRAKWYAQLWRRRFVSNKAKEDGVNIYHGLSAELPQGLSRHGIRSIVSIHDLIFLRFPQLYKAIDRKIYRRKALSACQRADLVIAISQQTRNDLIQLLGISPTKIKVIGQGCDPVFWEDHREAAKALIQAENIPQKFALFVGTLEPRKNPVALAKACIAEEIPLVLVGKAKKYWMDFEQSLSLAEKKFLYRPSVPENSTLAGLYQQSYLMAYPSDFEGFGIPLIEAMACGTALISSANSALQEVAGPGSILVKKNEVADLRQALRKFWDDADYREKAIAKNLNFVQQFRDSVIAEQWLDTYRELLGHD